MSRSGYDDCCDGWELICWRGAVASAIRGARGQAFLREMLAAMDALPKKRLIHGELVSPAGEVCAIGAVCRARGLDVSRVDIEDTEAVARAVGIAGAMAAEIMFINDEDWYSRQSPEDCFATVRTWVVEHLKASP